MFSSGGPIPFRFKNMRLEHYSFKISFRDWWKSSLVHGSESFKFTKKLKRVKKEKVWNREVFGDVRMEKSKICNFIEGLDMVQCEGFE